MLNLGESLDSLFSYVSQREYPLRVFSYSVGSFLLVKILRSLVSEVNILQLIPGFYLILLFLSFIILVGNSEILTRVSIELDNIKSYGIKTGNKLQILILSKFFFAYILIAGFFVIFFLIPVSLEAFSSYGEKALENLWSFTDLLFLEITLFLIISLIVQLPSTFLNITTNETIIVYLYSKLKIIAFVSFIFSGFLTPTIDGYTQLNFSLFAICLYYLFIAILQKRVLSKYPETFGLNF